jgi:hypothetical protein
MHHLGHVQGAKNIEFTISEDQRNYVFEDDTTLPAVKEALDTEMDWMKEYKERTGREWVGTTWPRPAPTYDMWQPKVRPYLWRLGWAPWHPRRSTVV